MKNSLLTVLALAMMFTIGCGGNVAQVPIAPGTRPQAVAVGDFNGDGKLDLAIANAGSNSVGILLGNGDGTFTLNSSPATGASPSSVAVGDFNGDGIPDLAVTNAASNTVSILLGNGDGTFTLNSTLATGTAPVMVAVGDFNGDGKPDLAVTNSGSNSVSIFLGKGDGTFTLKSTFSSVESGPGVIVVGDFDGDGKLDLAVAENVLIPAPLVHGYVVVFKGNGDGTFTHNGTVGSAANVTYSSIAVGDFNGDGIPDLAVTDHANGTVSIFTGNGNGVFTLKSTLTTGMWPSSVVVGDFNGDGIPDLAVANYESGGEVQIFTGNGDGTFTPLSPSPAIGAGLTATAVGNFNSDGKPDLAVTNFARGTVSILLGNGDGTFTLKSSPATGVSPQK
jgi:hypothetical protein